MPDNQIIKKVSRKNILFIALITTLLVIMGIITGIYYADKLTTSNNNSVSLSKTLVPASITSTTKITISPTLTNTSTPKATSNIPSFQTFTENTQKWEISYLDGWTGTKQTDSSSNNPGVSYYIYFKTNLVKNDHIGLFSIKQRGGGYIHGSYDECKNNPNGGAGLGHQATNSEIFTINSYSACKYTETSGDFSNVTLINTYVFIKDQTTGRQVSLSYAEDSSNKPQNNYPVNQWIYKDIFEQMQNSFKFI